MWLWVNLAYAADPLWLACRTVVEPLTDVAVLGEPSGVQLRAGQYADLARPVGASLRVS